MPTPGFSFGGEITVTADYYGYKSDPDSSQPGRRPAQLYRILFDPIINFSENFAIPFNIHLTTPETNTTTPSVPHPTLAQYFENPANAFGFSSITPRLGWANLFLGSHSPVYSPLSVGDQQIFGGGFDLKPGKFQFAASYGVSQRAIEPDTSRNIQGAFRRDMAMARVAFGDPNGSQFGINVVHAHDDPTSISNTIASIIPAHAAPEDTSIHIPADTVRLRAEEGYVASTDVKLKLGDAFTFAAEAAASIFTRDQSAAEKPISGNPFGSLVTTRTSTRADFAGSASIGWQKTAWGIKLTGLYMGAGFEPIGYSFVQPDKLEVSVQPMLKLFDGGFTLDGSVGERRNNLSGTLGASTTQFIGDANLHATFSDAFDIGGHYSNFGVRNDLANDTLKVQNVSQSFGLDPMLTLRSDAMTHTLSGSAGFDEYDDFNTISGAASSNKMRTAILSYLLSLNSSPLTLGVTGSYVENILATGPLIIRSAQARIGYSFFRNGLRAGFSATVASSSSVLDPTDDQLFLKLDLRIRATSTIDFTASFENNEYQYGNPLPKGKSFREMLARLGATAKF